MIDSGTEEHFFSVAEAQEADMARAVAAARQAFDDGPWPRMTHGQRAEYLRAPGSGPGRAGRRHRADLAPRVRRAAPDRSRRGGSGRRGTFEFYAGLADTFEWEQAAQPSSPGFGLLVREPVGVVGAIIPWNGPLGLISYKIAPALIAGCTVILKSSPEAPGEGYLVAEVAEEIGLPPGVINVVTADRAGVGTAGAGSARRQDHLHRLDRRRTADRLAVRRADRPLHPRARRKVGRRRSSTTSIWA